VEVANGRSNRISPKARIEKEESKRVEMGGEVVPKGKFDSLLILGKDEKISY